MATAPSTLEVGTPYSLVYLVTDVSRYLHLPYQRTRSWVSVIPGREPSRPPGEGLSFLDLISIRVIRKLSDIGVKPVRISRAERFLTHHYGEYPFARQVIWTDGYHVFFAPESPLREEIPEEFLISANAGGQQAFVDLLRQYLQDVGYGPMGLAVTWRPRDRVVLDPSRQFGQPCIKGTRILTESIHSLYRAGDSEEIIMTAYDLSYEDVREAIEWEESLIKTKAA